MTNIIDINSIKQSDLNRQFHEIITILKDPKQFKNEWENGDLEDNILDLSSGLEVEIGYSKELEELYNLCLNIQEVNEALGPYLASSNIHLKLIEKHSDEDIERFLQPFIDDPIETIDLLMEISDLLVLYGRASLAVKLCQNVFKRVEECDSFWNSPEQRLAKIIFCDELQKMMICQQAGKKLDWNNFDSIVRSYGYDFDDAIYFRFEEGLLGKIDPNEIRKQFKKSYSQPLWDIQIAFCSYMWGKKKMPFGTSEAFSTLILNFLAEKILSPNCGVDKFFHFTENDLHEHLESLMDTFLPAVEDGFALVWSLPVFYNYLHTIGLVDAKVVFEVSEICETMKNIFISNLPNSTNVFHFVDAFNE